MKSFITASLVLLLLASCGSSSTESYTVTDDNNGTKSPRPKEVINKTADNNKSEEKITRFTYNEDNLLITKENIYEDYSTRVTYTYNKNKQLISKTYHGLAYIGFNIVEYTYGDILYEKTKLPVVDTVNISTYLSNCTYKHTYTLNASNLASSIDKIHEICDDNYGHRENPNFQNNFPNDEYKIYNTNLTKHTEEYIYFGQSAIATYDKGLREKVEYYSPDETNSSKAPILESTSYYTYEEKPYFYKESSSPMVYVLPH